MYNGIVNVYKERGFTSHDAVAKLRGILKMKKIGHTGTLDPEAVGVLPVCLGSGTKLCDMLTDWDKEYIAVMRLGVVTDTQDMTGQVLVRCGEEKLRTLTEAAVREAVMGFVGGYDHNFVCDGTAGEFRKIAEARCEESGITMEVFTDCCGVQFYAGNAIAPQTGKGGVSYGKRSGFCLESQFYPNSINEPGFPSPLLKAGEPYDTKTSYRFSVK